MGGATTMTVTSFIRDGGWHSGTPPVSPKRAASQILETGRFRQFFYLILFSMFLPLILETKKILSMLSKSLLGKEITEARFLSYYKTTEIWYILIDPNIASFS